MNRNQSNHHQTTPQRRLKLLAALLLVCGGGSFVWFAPSSQAFDGTNIEPRSFANEYKRAAQTPFPDDNKFTAERELLGRTLFFDPRLSASDWISCATCHNPALSWGDGLAKGIGHNMKTLGRRTPTILNLAWAEPLFWDGRALTLEDQALGPIESPGEMNLPLDKMIAKLKNIEGYGPLFAAAYPGEPLNEKTVAKGIATFERMIISGTAPFDRWVAGDETAISEAAKNGFVLFNTKANCAKCHAGWRFTDDSFNDIGLKDSDVGRGRIFPTIEINQFAFKTPTLRNADRRAPFMHDGSQKTLAEVVEHYDRGGAVKRPSVSSEIKPLNLTVQEKAELVAFLKTLTSVDKPVEIPVLPR